MTISLNHDQARDLSFIRRHSPTSDSFDWAELQRLGLATDAEYRRTPNCPTKVALTVGGQEALAQHDADQKSKKAAEIEAAFKEGQQAGYDRYGANDPDADWNCSDAKKSLEVK